MDSITIILKQIEDLKRQKDFCYRQVDSICNQIEVLTSLVMNLKQNPIEQYFVTFDSRWYDNKEEKYTNISFFTPENGYDESMLEAIKELKRGLSIEVEKGHVVKRMI